MCTSCLVLSLALHTVADRRIHLFLHSVSLSRACHYHPSEDLIPFPETRCLPFSSTLNSPSPFCCLLRGEPRLWPPASLTDSQRCPSAHGVRPGTHDSDLRSPVSRQPAFVGLLPGPLHQDGSDLLLEPAHGSLFSLRAL